ncbi:MAG: flagellar basal body M-ring protein FliF [Rhodanobacter sp.]|nr:MAG: flagellar basal body M-ring protein FliF [Rhodanobacter sp.]TAM08265.1 MAG: flagellar basal body M-ring protein FliF [Rhodanobacter sp.]TAM37112.1 MAG: flagellar basal body M-ring protein FliF [Rhodanobacter sp.]
MADTAIATAPNPAPGNRLTSLKDAARTPAARQLMLLVAVAAAVALGVAVVLWSRGPNYGLLYAGLDQQDAAAITQELQASNTQYKLGADGTSIMVPAADLAALRLRLAAKGLPQGSAAINAQQANASPFGMSDLAERAHYQQMLENDLDSTIGALQSVRAARVHLALPKPSAFIRDNHAASASVLLTLYQGRQLDAGQVAAIVHLVAASVPGLDPGQVSVVDQQGRLLTSNSDAPGQTNDDRLRLATRIENTYAQRIEDLLTPLVGAGKVRAQVNADLDFSQSEKATETYNHDNPALRSEQVSSEQRTGAGPAGGVPGALSNQPPNTAAQPTAAQPKAGTAPTPGATTASTTSASGTETSSSATRNYELDRTISHVSDPAGRLARLTVAVVVDDKVTPASDPDAKPREVPFSPQELAHFTDLVKNAVGFEAQRGDSVSVINQAFHHSAAPTSEATPFWDRPGMLDFIKQGVGVLIALLVAFGVLRPLLKGLLRSAPAPATARALAGPMPSLSVRVDDDVALGEDGEAPARIRGERGKTYDQRVAVAKRLVTQDSKQVAQVVRSWVNEDAS